MQKYSDVVISTSGVPVMGASVSVRLGGTSTPATIYSDAGVTPKANPFTNESDGSFKFYAANGHYDIVFSKSGYIFDSTDTSDIILFDPILPNAVAATLTFVPDNTLDIGQTGANRPRTLYIGTSIRIQSNTGVLSFGAADDVMLKWRAANQLMLQNGLIAQRFYVYSTDNGAGNERGLVIDMANDIIEAFGAGTGVNGPLSIGTGGTGALGLYTNSTARWAIGGATGHFIAQTDNVFDIGTVGSRPRTGYFGTSLRVQSNTGLLSLGTADDVILTRDAANILALRNGTNNQNFRVYKTFTDALNYERLRVASDASGFFILSESAGTGAARDLSVGTVGASTVYLATDNLARWGVQGGTGHIFTNADNVYDLGITGNRPRTGVFGTSLISPLFKGPTGNVQLEAGGANDIYFTTNGGTKFILKSAGHLIAAGGGGAYDVGSLVNGEQIRSVLAFTSFVLSGSDQQQLQIKKLTELTTIAAAAFTDTTITIPADAVVLAVNVRVTVAIPTAATFDVGISGATTRYATGVSTAANTTAKGTLDAVRYYAGATAIRITPNLTPADTTGRVRVTIFYYESTPPAS